jgi:hemerythrin
MALVWTEDLAVGHGMIDTQHKELFSRYNHLLQACKAGKGREEITPALEFLAEYVAAHFAEEERHMWASGFPGIEEHKQQHREFREKIDELRRELQERGSTVALSTDLNHSLLNWLLWHVRQIDMKLARHLAKAED